MACTFTNVSDLVLKRYILEITTVSFLFFTLILFLACFLFLYFLSRGSVETSLHRRLTTSFALSHSFYKIPHPKGLLPSIILFFSLSPLIFGFFFLGPFSLHLIMVQSLPCESKGGQKYEVPIIRN